MADTEIYRGDSYAIRRPLYTHTFVDDNGDPFDLTSCTVRSTFKTIPTDSETDTTDSTAVIKATLIVDGTGTATTQTKMYLVGAATAGVCELRLSSTDTGAMLTDTDFFSDVELTDGNGEVFTFVMPDSLRVVEAYTNRTTG
jgi:hypothetical protein